MRTSFKWLILMGLVWGLTTPVVWAQKTTTQKTKKKVEITPEQEAEAERTFTEGMKNYMTEDYARAVPLFEKALETKPENLGILFALAQTSLKLDDANKALNYAERAFLVDDNNEYLSELLASLYQKKRAFPEAAKLYQVLLQKHPEHPEYGIALASVYLQQDKFEDALKAYERVEKGLGVNEDIIHQKQLILLKLNKFDDAVKEGERLIASSPMEVDYMVDLAELLMEHNRSDQAMGWLEKIVKIRPENAQAHIMLADFYRRKGDTARSNKELETAFNDPNLDALTKARLLTTYSGALTDDKSKENALKFAQNLVETNPHQAQAYVLYADLLLQKNDKRTARDMYARAVRIDKSMKEVWDRVLDLDGELNQADSLLAHADEAIEVFPNQAEYWYSSGAAYLIKRNYRKAVESLEEAQRLAGEGGSAAEIAAQLGDAYNGAGQSAKSNEAYEAALKLNPANDHVLNNYSYFLSLRKENLARARELAAKLVELHPNNSTYLDTYGWVLYVSGDYPKAKTYLEKAAQGSASSSTVVEHYGDVFQLGEREKALEQWKKAKTLGPNNPQLEKKISSGVL